MAHSITLTNKNNKKYRFFDAEVQSANFNLVTKLFKATIPDSEGDDTILINLGREQSEGASFSLRDTPNDDASVGTQGSPVNTIQEKVDYILNTFLTPGIEDLYFIDLETTVANILLKQGIIENFRFDFQHLNILSLSGSFSFSIGGGLQQ